MSNDTDFESYEQHFRTIPASKAFQIRTLLEFVAFGNEPLMRARGLDRHPLTLSHLTEVTGYEINSRGPAFNPDRCLSPDEILKLCEGILESVEAPRNRHLGDSEKITSVQFSNERIRDFLLSDAIKTGPVAHFAITSSRARETIVNVCLTYMSSMYKLPEEKRII